MLTFLYDTQTGESMGVTTEPENYDCGKTTVEPPVFDEFERKQAYFINGAWEIRDAS